MNSVVFPTTDHAEAARLVSEYASELCDVDTVLVVNSCARGQAVPESDLDMALLISGHFDEAALETDWKAYLSANEELQRFRSRSAFSEVHLDFFDGRFVPQQWDDGGGPDDFEIEIGNRVAHAVPLRESGTRFKALQAEWLPYYEEPLRLTRLTMARSACLHDLECIPFYVGRDLLLQAFDRLYKAFQEFLQATFIASRTYPIAYNKWLEEQLHSIGRGELYSPLLSILGVSNLTGRNLKDRAIRLRELADAIF